VVVSGLRCGPEKIIKTSSSRRRIRESFLPVKYLTASYLSLIFRSSAVYWFWFRCSLVLTLDLYGIDFCFFLLSLVYSGWWTG
jgi:hypothetical protein